MGASSLILALSALWTGPSWGQDRSGIGPIGPVHISGRGELMIPGGSGRGRHGERAYDCRRGLHYSGDTQAAYCRPVLSTGSLGARVSKVRLSL